MSIKKIATATALGVALIGTTLVAPAPANATHKFGHAIAGGIIGGIIGGAIVNNQRRTYYRAPPPVYVAPAPVYGQYPQQHYNFCFRKAPNSYDPNSNTYQPFNGPRRWCSSPWVR